jgi:hypothetical protein
MIISINIRRMIRENVLGIVVLLLIRIRHGTPC